MIVVDSSALVHAFTSREVDERLLDRLQEESLRAPHLLDSEVLHALRGLATERKVAEGRADQALTLFRRMAITRHPVGEMAERIWQLRHTMTAYDATYVALAEVLRCPLVTMDNKLVSGCHQATVEIYGKG